MPLVHSDGSLYNWGAPKKTNDEWQKKNKEERDEIKNQKHREQYEYYVGLYEKYKTKDWDYVKRQMDEEKEKEKRKNELIRKENKRKEDSMNAVARMFSITKKEMDGSIGERDKW